MRRHTLSLLAPVALERQSVIPRGLRNNLHWQAGHIVTVQASLLYLRCGLRPFLDDSFLVAFAKGTSPAEWTGREPSYESILKELESAIETLKRDLPRYADTKYPEQITVSTGDVVTSFADALRFLPIHEAIHQGAISTMVRILGVKS